MEDQKHHHFVGIGAQKAGTSWLHAQLTRHPQIALPERKETHYFDMVTNDRTPINHGIRLIQEGRKAVRGNKRDIALLMLELLALNFQPPSAYINYLARTATPETKIIGDITPSYACLSRDGFHLMKQVLDPKVIFIMRDPLSRYWSAVRMSTPDAKHFKDAFRTSIHKENNWVRSDYATTVRLVDETFAPENVLYLFYEDLVSEDSIQQIARFLGVEPQWPYDVQQVVRKGRSQPMPAVPPEVARKLAPIYSFVHERFGDQVPSTWQASLTGP